MPKKTKKQKIITEYRKKIRMLQTQLPNQNDKPQITAKEEPLTVPTKIDQTPAELTFFKTDLKKSLIITSAIITLEIIFYYATIYNYLRF